MESENYSFDSAIIDHKKDIGIVARLEFLEIAQCQNSTFELYIEHTRKSGRLHKKYQQEPSISYPKIADKVLEYLRENKGYSIHLAEREGNYIFCDIIPSKHLLNTLHNSKAEFIKQVKQDVEDAIQAAKTFFSHGQNVRASCHNSFATKCGSPSSSYHSL